MTPTLQFLLIPIRDWNLKVGFCAMNNLLQFLLIPIRDWNNLSNEFLEDQELLQFLLIPIRDWNMQTQHRPWVDLIAISTNPY